MTAAENPMTCISGGATGLIQDAAYDSAFDPSNQATREIATDATSPTPTGTLVFPVGGGHTIVYVVNTSSSGGLCPGYSITLTADRPWATQRPVVTAGSTGLTATDATYTGPISALSRSWLRCDATGSACSPTGSTGTSYAPTSADSGHTLRLRDTATNSDGTSTTDSQPLLVVTVPGPTTTVPGPTVTRTITFRERTVCKTKLVRRRVHGRTKRIKKRQCRKVLVRTVS